jgi:uncharacterized protein
MQIQMTIKGLMVDPMTNMPIVVLRDLDGQKVLPIWVGVSEANAIAVQIENVTPQRPMTHDLLKNVIEDLGHTLTEVRIVALQDQIFYASLIFDGGVEVSARSSDAIALALRTGTTILAEEALLDEAGVAIAQEEDDEVERFKEFLDQVSAEDFETTDEPGPSEEPPPGSR